MGNISPIKRNFSALSSRVPQRSLPQALQPTLQPAHGRLAPSPTGFLHIGNAVSLLAAWLDARAAGGSIDLRIEDIDTQRVKPGYDTGIIEDLCWLGIDWDGKVQYQACRHDEYTQVIETLRTLTVGQVRDFALANATQSSRLGWYVTFSTGESTDSTRIDGAHSDGTRINSTCIGSTDNDDTCPLVYPCFCSRAQIRAASAPNEGDGVVVYPGTCRMLSEQERARRLARGDRHSWRIAVPRGVRVCWEDGVFGRRSVDLARELGDVIVRRSDGLDAYQFAVSYDDMVAGVNRVVRGRDLLASTAVQCWIRVALALQSAHFGGVLQSTAAPGSASTAFSTSAVASSSFDFLQSTHFAHIPLIVNADHVRLAKRDAALELRQLRERGVSAEQVLGWCAWALGLVDSARSVDLQSLLDMFSWEPLTSRHEDVVFDPSVFDL